jgi:hypothetical protein
MWQVLIQNLGLADSNKLALIKKKDQAKGQARKTLK